MNLDPLAAFLLTNAIGAAGGILLFRLKVPAGAMIGSMIAVMVFNIFAHAAVYPDDIRKYVQIASGILIGCRIQRKDVGELKKVIVPSLLLMLGMFTLNLSFAFLFTRFGGLDINTSLFAAAPGGMSDMALIAEDLGANTAQVAMLQLARILFIISLFPALFKWLAARGWRLIRRKRPAAGGTADGPGDSGSPLAADVSGPAAAVGACALAPDVCPEPGPSAAKPDSGARSRLPMGMKLRSAAGSLRIRPASLGRFLLTIGIAVAGGLLFFSFGIPAGAMIGAMLATALFGVLSGKALFPTKLRPLIQISVGAFLGARMTMDSLLSLRDLMIPALIMLVGLIIASLGFGYLIHRITGLSISTCFLASTPGGLAEMSLIAEELGCDAPKVAVMHTFRLMMVILLFPTLLRVLSGILS
ncbi:MAG: AbrB family transcriptional regulator [Clostridia bacterium]|nr:AbrB family transcriptional regulator [Clostridia bacterium]